MEHATWTVRILEGLLSILIVFKIFSAISSKKKGQKIFIRKIPGLMVIDEAV